MTQFSSRPPFNDDPEPWTLRTRSGELLERASAPRTASEFEPRPEFDRPQHNPTNPILTAVRMDTGATYASVPESVEAYLEHICERRTIRDANAGFGVWKPAHIDHARRVLTHLANLTKEN